MIYVFQRGEGPDAPVKIGRTTSSGLRSRLYAIQTGCPETVHIIATLRGGAPAERDLHRRFASSCIGGEWFRKDPLVSAWLDDIGASDPSESSVIARASSRRVSPVVESREPSGFPPALIFGALAVVVIAAILLV